jgi:diguanylate cyclase (GGDEF)-like protein
VCAVLCLALAYAAYLSGLLQPISDAGARIVFAGLCLAIPLDIAALTLLRERGVFNFYGVRRMGIILLQVALVVWALVYQRNDLAHMLYLPLWSQPATYSDIPHAALLLMGFAIVVSVARAVTDGSALDAGLAAALACFVIACQTLALPHYFPVFIGAGAAVLVTAVLQDTFRLAFRDELTGLPSRRALNERLLQLGTRYTIAMVDVDHFKQFNDRYGHDLGDHVLRMVAAKLRTVGGGGRAYRYGGEEFTLVFPGRSIRDAWPYLEALRQRIGQHPLVLRRLGQAPGGRDRQSGQPDGVYVTVSIGVAARTDRHATAGAVLRSADRALYRAKDKGRDRVSL